MTLPALFSDHAVLQRSAKVPFWGKADPDEAVTVTAGNIHATAVADTNGRWRVDLNLEKAAVGPQEIVIQGKNRLSIADVVVGEVWVCSGQSNMQWPLSGAQDSKDEIARSSNPMLRVFRLTVRAPDAPLEDCVGKWIVTEPARAGEFTAVGYYFGQKLQRELGAPVGLIDNSWGGSPIEPWVSPTAFDEDEALKASKEWIFEQRDTFAEKEQAHKKALNEWLARYDRKDEGGDKSPRFAEADLPVDGWTAVTMPGDIDLLAQEQGGVVWIRKEVDLPASSEGKSLTLNFGVIRGFEDVYWNGVRIGKTTLDRPVASLRVRAYPIPKQLIRSGKNTVAIRIFAPVGGIGITPHLMEAYTAGAVPSPRPFGINGGASLRGKWLAKAERVLPPLSSEVLKTYPEIPVRPDAFSTVASVYNGMIAPIIPYAIQGVLWYQGGSKS